jgi:hypothetical protein
MLRHTVPGQHGLPSCPATCLIQGELELSIPEQSPPILEIVRLRRLLNVAPSCEASIHHIVKPLQKQVVSNIRKGRKFLETSVSLLKSRQKL